MEILENRFFQSDMPGLSADIPYPGFDAETPVRLLNSCPAFKPTPLATAPALAQHCGVGHLAIKDERQRLGLGSFKALGAAYVIAHDAQAGDAENFGKALEGMTYVAASAGNHGLSVAAGAAIFGAKAVIYLSQAVPESFAERLRDKQAIVVRSGQTYEQSMQAATQAAQENNWQLLSDSSWPGYYQIPHRLMEGYLALASEAADQMKAPPSNIFSQAGVGGFAAAMAAFFRKVWGTKPIIIVVEPAAAPALIESIRAGKAVTTTGPVSSMGRLDCKEPSLIALKGLARDANYFVTVSDEEVAEILPLLAQQGFATTPSGAAGLAGLFLAHGKPQLRLNGQSSVLAFITEEGQS